MNYAFVQKRFMQDNTKVDNFNYWIAKMNSMIQNQKYSLVEMEMAATHISLTLQTRASIILLLEEHGTILDSGIIY